MWSAAHLEAFWVKQDQLFFAHLLCFWHVLNYWVQISIFMWFINIINIKFFTIIRERSLSSSSTQYSSSKSSSSGNTLGTNLLNAMQKSSCENATSTSFINASGMACRHLFQIVLIQLIAGLTQCENLVEKIPLLLWGNRTICLNLVLWRMVLCLKIWFFQDKLGCQQERVIHLSFEGLNLKITSAVWDSIPYSIQI